MQPWLLLTMGRSMCFARWAGELNDLSLEHPAKVKELSALISDRLREWNAPMPAFKSTGMRVPYPDEVSE